MEIGPGLSPYVMFNQGLRSVVIIRGTTPDAVGVLTAKNNTIGGCIDRV